MNNPRLFAVTTKGCNSEKAGEASVEFIIPRHKCRGNAKTLTLWMDTN